MADNADVEETIFSPVSYAIRDCANYRLGPFQFKFGVYKAETPENAEALDGMIATLPRAFKSRISKTTAASGAELVKAHKDRLVAKAHAGGADSSTNTPKFKETPTLPVTAKVTEGTEEAGTETVDANAAAATPVTEVKKLQL